MIGAIRAELTTLKALRSTWLIVIGGLLLTAFFAVIVRNTELEHALHVEVIPMTLTALMITALLGAGGFAHRAIIWTLLANPKRWRAFLSGAVAAAVIGAIVAVLCLFITMMILEIRSHLVFGVGFPGVVGAHIVVGALTGVFGFSLGMVLRHTTAAVAILIIGGFVAPIGLLIYNPLNDVAQYLPFGEFASAAGGAALANPNVASQLPAGTSLLLLIGWAVGMGLLGLWRLRRDV